MTGREKIESAFPSAVTPEISVALCNEGFYIPATWCANWEVSPGGSRHQTSCDRAGSWQRARPGCQAYPLDFSHGRPLKSRPAVPPILGCGHEVFNFVQQVRNLNIEDLVSARCRG